MDQADTLEAAAAEARACTLCADHLPLGPRPILRVSATARLLIASQAPGTKVHYSGTPWTDESGKRLRGWLGLTPEVFYDGALVAILPMGLCYPGRLPSGGDAPPRPECAARWRPRLLALMPQLQLILLVGAYAQADTLGRGIMTERVRAGAIICPGSSHCPTPPGAPASGKRAIHGYKPRRGRAIRGRRPWQKSFVSFLQKRKRFLF